MSARETAVRAVAVGTARRARKPLIEGFRVHAVGVEIDAGVNQRTWYEFGKLLQQAEYAREWIMADWLAFGEHQYGDKIYQQASRLFGKSPRTWEDYAYIARNVKTSERSEILSLLVHKPVARFSAEPDVQRKLLGIAENYGLSKATFEVVIECYLEGKGYTHLLPGEITPVERARIKGQKERDRVLKRARKEGSEAWLEYVKEQAKGWQDLLRQLKAI